MIFPCLTDTIFSSNFAKTSTLFPTSETDGARMNTPLNDDIPIGSREISASNESFCLPKEFLSILTSSKSSNGCSTSPTTLSVSYTHLTLPTKA